MHSNTLKWTHAGEPAVIGEVRLFAELGALDAVIQHAAAWFEGHLNTRLETGAHALG